jgi:hypothetical protein
VIASNRQSKRASCASWPLHSFVYVKDFGTANNAQRY